jgi:RimJ/RimL family protein N-acetyltransferase
MGNPFLQPTLDGTLLRLRPLRAEDWDELYACASDPLIWEQHPHSNRYQREIFLDFFDGAMKSGGALAVLDRATGAIIGSSRYYDLALVERLVAIGFTFLARRFWGGRYNGELKSLMLDHAFKFADRVRFEIGESNLRSRRAIEKIGARLSGQKTIEGKTQVVYELDAVSFRRPPSPAGGTSPKVP